MAKRPEESARAILRIVVSGGTKPDEIVLYGNLERAFLEVDPNSLAPEFVEGLKYAEGQGWLTIIEGTQIKLTFLTLAKTNRRTGPTKIWITALIGDHAPRSPARITRLARISPSGRVHLFSMG
jgi:hypothetical protein